MPFEEQAFKAAVKKTGRKRLIVGGRPHRDLPDVCRWPGAEGRLRRLFVTDAVGGGRSQTGSPHAIDRLSHAGAVPITHCRTHGALPRLEVTAADKAREVIAWYFAEVPKVTRKSVCSE